MSGGERVAHVIPPEGSAEAPCCGRTMREIMAAGSAVFVADPAEATCPGPRIPEGRGIIARCGTCGGEQRVFLPDHPRAEAEMFAGLLDGSAFRPPPGPEYLSNRCGRCWADRSDRAPADPTAWAGGRITCTLFGYDPSSGAPAPAGQTPLGSARGGGPPVS